jgi:hypothetical protein
MVSLPFVTAPKGASIDSGVAQYSKTLAMAVMSSSPDGLNSTFPFTAAQDQDGLHELRSGITNPGFSAVHVRS